MKNVLYIIWALGILYACSTDGLFEEIQVAGIDQKTTGDGNNVFSESEFNRDQCQDIHVYAIMK
ncbi:hypothetical protein [Christiangramia sabulilitoris]|uniref:Uncharacterized protein n=1 Tax=Christiangramia sabulilitoris TaxID=2583991 RepID=A0A550I310_9FLAO|nr:hypothetical protein [Christiangramia sabulilitoris]TRO65367.1 hypothetical protein FGM01_08135 [Christiangramia sabulilitoris]